MAPTIVYPLGQHLPGPRASDRLAVRTAAALAHAGASVLLLAPAPLPPVAELLVTHGVAPTARLELVPIPERPRFLYPSRLVRRARAVDAWAVFTSELAVAEAFARTKGRRRAPVFYEAQSLLAERAKRTQRAHRFFDAREAAVLEAVDGVVVAVSTLARTIEETYRSAPVHVVPLAAAWAEEVSAEPVMTSRPPRHLGYFGQLQLIQGVDLLIEVLSLLPEHHLTISGGGELERDWLKSEAVRFGVLDRVTIVPFDEHTRLAERLRDIDVLLIPARPRDRMPYAAQTKALEYLAYGRPIVAADLPSLREELGEGTSLLVEPEDRLAWANAIRRLDEDPDLSRQLVEGAWLRARLMTWEARARALLGVLGSRG